MSLLKRLTIFLFLINAYTITSAQNWMMAQHYMSITIDTLIQIRWPNTGSLTGFKIDYLGYDEIAREYTIQFTDTIECDIQDIPLKSGKIPDIVIDSGELIVSLEGGIATYEDRTGEITVLELPDLSEVVYIYNDTGREISFSLSDDDENFEQYTLQVGQFYFFPCFETESAYIKMATVINNAETGKIHYKLDKARGYRVRFDEVNSKFEVYLDERMSLEDFK